MWPRLSCKNLLSNYIDPKLEIPPVPFFTPEEEDYFVEQYSIQGFKHSKSIIFY
jgi:hypothetical protein